MRGHVITLASQLCQVDFEGPISMTMKMVCAGVFVGVYA